MKTIEVMGGRIGDCYKTFCVASFGGQVGIESDAELLPAKIDYKVIYRQMQIDSPPIWGLFICNGTVTQM